MIALKCKIGSTLWEVFLISQGAKYHMPFVWKTPPPKASKRLISFGYKFGEPNGVIIDIREYDLYNGHNLTYFKDRDGRDKELGEWMMSDPNYKWKMQGIQNRIQKTVGSVIYLGCQGGRHRSVFVAERLARQLGFGVEHRDLYRYDATESSSQNNILMPSHVG